MRLVFKRPQSLLKRAAWLLFFSLTIFPAACRAGDNPYPENLIKEAKIRRLSEKREWHSLIHYRPSIIYGYESIIDDPRFFLSEAGKHDPEKEIEATLRAFFRTDIKDGLHPRCRFPARLSWLKKELGTDGAFLPQEDCKEFREYFEAISPESAVLVFPVAHMNSPASMFGHTLLRIDSKSESKLFSFAVNYSAKADDTNGFLFAFKGIFGFYEGYFGILPYYEKIKEYNNLDNRDMWEYRLNFTKDEVVRIVEHMWELKGIYAYYYFFDENCSYNLLLVLEAGRPDLRLTQSLPGWVIPMETVRAVEEAGLIGGEPSLRPSRATRIRRIESGIAPEHQRLAIGMVYKKAEPDEVLNNGKIEKADKIKTLDLASEYLQYLYSKREVERDEYLSLYLKILSARSSLGKAEGYSIDPPLPPDKGHGSFKLSIGAGAKRGASYLSFNARPANHGLMDPDGGYLPGAAISFMDTEFRYNFTEHKLSLEKLTFLEITSISEVGRFFKPVSWKVNAGVLREEFAKREHRTVFKASAGPGLSFNKGGLFYIFAEPVLKISGDLDDSYSFGGGVAAGFLKQVTDVWKTQIQARAEAFEIGDKHRVYSVEANQLFSVDANNALNLNLKRVRFDGFYSSDISLAWNRYF